MMGMWEKLCSDILFGSRREENELWEQKSLPIEAGRPGPRLQSKKKKKKRVAADVPGSLARDIFKIIQILEIRRREDTYSWPTRGPLIILHPPANTRSLVALDTGETQLPSLWAPLIGGHLGPTIRQVVCVWGEQSRFHQTVRVMESWQVWTNTP